MAHGASMMADDNSTFEISGLDRMPAVVSSQMSCAGLFFFLCAAVDISATDRVYCIELFFVHSISRIGRSRKDIVALTMLETVHTPSTRCRYASIFSTMRALSFSRKEQPTEIPIAIMSTTARNFQSGGPQLIQYFNYCEY